MYHGHVMVSWVILMMLSWSEGPAGLWDGLDHPVFILPVVSRPDQPPGAPVTVRRESLPRTLDGDELLKIGDLHEVQNHLQEALPYYQRALAAFRAKKDRRGEAAALVRIGSIHERQGSHAEALAALDAAVPILATVGEDRPHAHALLKLGRILESLGRMAEAQEAYDHARTLFQRSHDRKGYAESLIRLGSLWTAQDRVAEALPILQTALIDSRDRQDAVQQMAALTVTGDARIRAGEPGVARTLYEEGLQLAEAQRDVRAEADVRIRLVRLLFNEARYAEGLKMAQRALALYQSLRDRSQEADTLSLLGSLHQAEGNTTLAAEHHERALTLYRALRDRMREAASLANLAAAYETSGSLKEAQETQQKVIFLLQSPVQ